MKKMLILLMVTFAINLSAQTTTEFLWTKHIGGMDDDYLVDMAADSEGSIYATFRTESDELFYEGQSILQNKEAMLAKFSSEGELLWTFEAVSTDFVYLKTVKINSFEDIFVIGAFQGTVQLGDTTLADTTGEHESSNILLKFDSQGNMLWVKRINPIQQLFMLDMAMDQEDNIFFSCRQRDTIYWEETLTLVKADPNGIVQWWKQAKTDWYGYTRGRAVTIDHDGNVIIAGNYRGSYLSWENDTIEGNYENYLLFLKVDNDGNFIWANLPHGSSPIYSYDVTVDSENDIYVTGHVSDTVYFDTTQITLSYKDQMFVTGISSDGNVKWVKTTETSAYGSAQGSAISSDMNDNIYIAGKYENGVSFGGYQLSTNYWLGFDGLITKMNGSGTIEWVSTFYNNTYMDDYYRRRLIFDPENNLITSGNFTLVGIFGNDTLDSHGYNDIYLSKLKEIETGIITSEKPENGNVYFANGLLYIRDADINEPTTVSIYSMAGQEVYATSVNQNDPTAIRVQLHPGLYVVKIFNSRRLISNKIFVSH